MKKKYIKPDIKNFPISTVYGQTEGVCWAGGTAADCSAGASVSGAVCSNGGTDINYCTGGLSPGSSHCLSGESAHV